MAVADENRMAEIIDIELRFMDVETIDGEDKFEVLDFMFQVAFVCLSENPDERPTMAECYSLIQGGSVIDKYKDREADVGGNSSSGYLSNTSSRYDSSRGGDSRPASATYAASETSQVSVVGLRMQGAR